MSIAVKPILHTTQRNFESPQYALPSDDDEKERLNAQHRITVKAFDSKLFMAPVSLKEGDRVLESGAGTGIWVMQLAEQVPSTVQIQSIDITSKLFPANHPTNLHFSINSITSLPESWTSSFAFVHQRFLVGALTGDTWKTAISEMSRVVMAGGWIELVEMTGEFPQVGPHSTKVTLLFGEIMRDKQFLFHCPIQVPAMLQQAGFVNVRSECRMVPLGRSAGQDGIDGSTNLAALTDAVKTPILRAAGYGHVHSEAEYDAMVSGAKEEWLSSDVEFPFYTIYAQKPA